MENKTEPVKSEHIIAVYDLENFTKIAREIDSIGTFKLLDSIYSLSIKSMKDHGLVFIKNIGDGAFLLLDPSHPDDTVLALNALKSNLEEMLHKEGYNNRFSFSAHVGEVTMGTIGINPFSALDAFGDAINVAFTMEGKPFRNRFSLSPQLFRRLGKETRKIFHKFTPQIVYLAD